MFFLGKVQLEIRRYAFIPTYMKPVKYFIFSYKMQTYR